MWKHDRRAAWTATAPTRGSSARPGGKDFIVAHASADPQALAVAIVRGGFEYQGQKCSAASRVYVPRSIWNDVRDRVVAHDREIARRRRAGLPELHGRRHRREGLRPHLGLPGGREAQREDPRRRRGRRREGLLRRAHPGRDRGPRLQAALRGDLRAGRHGVRLRRREVGRDAARSSTRRRPTRSPAPSSRTTGPPCARRQRRCAARPATST